MAKIKKLDQHVADLIAAGEVVERPASAVKELMENSIDAGAGSITVEIRRGGMEYIRVTDDGSGILPEDVETAFLRHATSKLYDSRGLEAIKTLGFRGEALAAISAVSHVELMTCVPGETEGRRVLCDGGNVVSNDPAGCPGGTTIIVRDLFFNTPARLKFMKSDKSEGAAVSAAVLREALSHPEVSVRYVKDGKEEFHTPGDGNLQSLIYSLFGREFSGELLKAECSYDGISVCGYVSSPAYSRGNRGWQYFFVNGRYVKSQKLQAALEQAYKNTLFTGKFPACILYITISYGAVDVNVHPTKTEVKFADENSVFHSVYDCVLSALERETPGLNVEISRSTERLFEKAAPVMPENRGHAPVGSGGDRPSRPRLPLYSEKRSSEYGILRDSAPSFFGKRDTAPAFRPAAEPVPETPGREAVKGGSDRKEMPGSDSLLPEEQTVMEGVQKTPFRIIGEAMETYIIAQRGNSLWLIDKHAAHERMHFDRMRGQKKETVIQPLLLPLVCRFSPEEAAIIEENGPLLERLGFKAESLGMGNVAIRQIPAQIDETQAESVISDICAAVKRGDRQPDTEAVTDEIYHTMACKAAIKAGMKTTPQEMEIIAEKVFSGEIRYCPHGRPAAVELTKSALDRLFKRI